MQLHPVVRLLFSLFALTVSAAGHAIVASWALRAFPALRKQRRALIFLGVALVLYMPASRWALNTWRADWASRAYALAMAEMMLVVLGAIPLGLARLAFLGIAKWTRNPSTPASTSTSTSTTTSTTTTTPTSTAPLTRREVLDRVGGLAVLGTSTAMLGWGMVRGRHAFRIEEVVVKVAGWPRALDGYTIAQISDLHVGVFVGERELAEGLARVREVRPDLVVATGDLIDFDARHTPMLARALSNIATRDGVVAIVGNHDYYSGVDAVIGGLRAGGIEVLVNAGKRVRPGDGGGFALLGVDDLHARRSGGAGPDLTRAMAMVPPDVPRILLAHQPPYVEQIAGQVALQLSGHTHGGQINPGFRPADLFATYIEGRYELGGTTLWVNRGFGVAGPPSRVGAPPEVTKVVLVAA